MDAKRSVAWLAKQGYDRIGILGTSLGSCLSLLAAAHEPLIRVQALNHVSPYFADVVWRGLSTSHVRAGLEGHIGLEQLRQLWMPISPQAYLDRVRDKKTLLVYAKYDLTFPSIFRGISSANSTVAVFPTSWPPSLRPLLDGRAVQIPRRGHPYAVSDRNL